MPPTLPQSLHSLPHSLDLRSLLSSLPYNSPRSQPSTSTPTRSLSPQSLSSLFRRQVATVTATVSSGGNPIIPAYYSGLNNGPTPGTVVGIVFGSVAGFLLLLWLIYTCFNFSGQLGRSSVVDERDIRVRSRSSRRRSLSSHTEEEVIEVTRSTRDRSRSRTRTPPRRQNSRRETVIIEETRRAAAPPRSEPEEVVEVFEEHSPVRRESKKESRRVSGSYRTVDPEAFGGGDRPMRKVSRR